MAGLWHRTIEFLQPHTSNVGGVRESKGKNAYLDQKGSND